MRLVHRALVLLVALSPQVTASSPDRRPLTLGDVFALREVREACIRPDGEAVAFTLMSTDSRTGRVTHRIWVAPTGVGEAAPFTAGPGSDWHARFSADGQSLAFLSDRSGAPQLYWMPTHGGEARRVTDFEHGVLDFTGSPDGLRFVIVAEERDAGGASGSALPGVRMINPLRGVSRRSRPAGLRAHLFVVAREGGAACALTSGSEDDFDPTFTPDGRSIVFVSNRTADARSAATTDLFVAPVAGGAARRLTSMPGQKSWPTVSPDGQWVAFVAGSSAGSQPGDGGLYIVPIAGGDPQLLGGAAGLRIAGAQEFARPRFSPDGATIYFAAIEGGETTIWAMLRGEGSPRRIVLGPARNFDFTLSARGTRIAFVRSEVDQPGEVWIASLDTPGLRRLTEVNRSVLTTVRFAGFEPLHLKSSDGDDVDAILLKPANFEAGRRCPAAVVLPGSMGQLESRSFVATWQLLAASGYAVLFLQSRMAAPGQDSGASEGTPGLDVLDVLSALDETVSRGIVDAEHVGLVSWSDAGFLATRLLSTTGRFHAAVLGAGAPEMVALQGRTGDRFTIGGPWRTFQRSPAGSAAEVLAPTLVVEAGEDDALWTSHLREIVASLQKRGIASRLLRFEEAGGSLEDRGYREEFARSLVGWLDAHLKPAPTPPQGQ